LASGKVNDLGTCPGGLRSYAVAINERGQAVGRCDTQDGRTHAFLWDPEKGAMTDLGTLPGGAISYASGINERGQVVGGSGTSTGLRAFLWDPTTKTMTDLGTLPGRTESDATDINARGQVVGLSWGVDTTAFLWDPITGAMSDLGPSSANGGAGGGAGPAINDRGEVVGETGSPYHAALWDRARGTTIDLGTLPASSYSYASDINERGQVVGVSGGHATLWTPVVVEGAPVAPVIIDFETYPDGSPTCADCSLTDQYASLGATFSFESPFSDETHASLLQTTNNPEGVPNHDATNQQAPTGGSFVGTVVMTFSGSPIQVRFEARVNNIIPTIPVAAYDPNGAAIPASQIERSRAVVYSPGTVAFRQDVVTITSASGIARVEIDTQGGSGVPGFTVLIDEVRIRP
jgi:probable HAF family extracellular repeat protein